MLRGSLGFAKKPSCSVLSSRGRSLDANRIGRSGNSCLTVVAKPRPLIEPGSLISLKTVETRVPPRNGFVGTAAFDHLETCTAQLVGDHQAYPDVVFDNHHDVTGVSFGATLPSGALFTLDL